MGEEGGCWIVLFIHQINLTAMIADIFLISIIDKSDGKD
jgi:hypothetical protein